MVEDASRQHAAIEREILRLESQLERKQRALKAQEDLHQEILASTSWRITAPLRLLSTKFLGKSPAPAYNYTSLVPKSGVEKGVQANQAPPLDGTDAKAGDTAARLKQLAPGLPSRYRVELDDGPDAANSTYRMVDCSSAIASMIGDPASKLFADEGEAAYQASYVGRRKEPAEIAFLGSMELLRELAFDAHVTPIRERHWSEDLIAGRFAFALIETVWHVENREWRYALIADGHGRASVEAMLRYCRQIGLPVVLWYREDASNYAHFAWLAAHADRVYAVDEAIASRLRAEYPAVRVGLLPPAIQPALHNPVRPASLASVRATSELRKRILFDGWWELLEGAAADPLLRELRGEMAVVESEWDFSKLRLDDCADFKERALGCVSTLDKVALSKLFGAEVFLRSALMLDWRQNLMMLRSAACGAIVIHPQAGSALREAGIAQGGDREELAEFVRKILGDPLQRARIAHRNFRQITSRHCLADRLQQIADDLGIAARFVDPPPRVACLLVTMRPQLLPQCIQRFRNDVYPAKELVVVVHGRDYDLRAAQALVRPGEAIRLFQLGRERSLGACLNFAFAHTDAPYWTKVDDDDLYGTNYLSDLMLYQRAMDAPLFGKPLGFVYYEANDKMHWIPSWVDQRALLLRQPGQGKLVVAGGTIGGRREVLETLAFSERRRRGSDAEYLQRCHDRGYAALATDCFNFALFRSAQQGFHTWDIGDERVQDRSRLVTTLAEASATTFL